MYFPPSLDKPWPSAFRLSIAASCSWFVELRASVVPLHSAMASPCSLISCVQSFCGPFALFYGILAVFCCSCMALFRVSMVVLYSAMISACSFISSTFSSSLMTPMLQVSPAQTGRTIIRAAQPAVVHRNMVSVVQFRSLDSVLYKM